MKKRQRIIFHPGVLPMKAAGFSLIQMSIILMVASLILVSFIPGREAGDYNQKAALSLHRLQKVEDAMRAFMAAYGRRPCPADGQYAVNNAKFGLEADNPGTCTGGGGTNGVSAPLGPDAATGFVVGGVIPTKTLNIPDQYAFDAWGRRFTYVVDTRATEAGSCYYLQEGMSYDGVGAIAIKDASGGVKDYTMVAYISHGADGDGAFPEEGSTVSGRINTHSTDTDTLNNASVNTDFSVNFDNIFVQKLKTASFDDIVYYAKNLKNTCCLGTVCTSPIGFRIDDVSNGDLAGAGPYSITTGKNFIVVGVPNASPQSKSGAGSVFIIPYNSLGVFPSLFSDSSIKRIDGEAAGDHFGAAVAVGTVTTDLSDVQQLIVGAPGHVVNVHDGCGSGTTTQGAVYVIFNPSSLARFNNATTLINANAAVRIDGSASTFGTVLAVGDVNGDATQDLAIGVPNAYGQQLQSNAGVVFVLFGTSTTVWEGRRNTYGETNGWVIGGDSNLYGGSDVESPDGFIIYNQDYSYSAGPLAIGSALAIGDIDGDGKGDVIIGTSGSPDYVGDYVYVVFGPGAKPTYFGKAPTSPWPDYSYVIDNIPSNSPIVSLAASRVRGSINAGNPIDDIIIGVGGANGGAGQTYVVFGSAAIRPAMPIDVTTLNGSNGFTLTGGSGGAGTSVASADVNDDGYADIVIGAPNTNSNKGGAYVVFGGGSIGSSGSFDLSALAGGNGSSGFYLAGTPSTASLFAIAVASGDATGNDMAEVIVGVPDMPNGTGHGSIFGVYGSATWKGNNALGSLKCHYCP